ncbi:hypothetical protein HYALB_00007894 [Hymenoscyphus albidus]|uniref:Uncharacterized protein n=1 Tax=Hymenoscyphus albidus TaxID=595503 RepID=A0A9N9Q142_9HELO|nr:hypothetical protein HYALB_00007894 [Hymenoscyphus albidus]
MAQEWRPNDGPASTRSLLISKKKVMPLHQERMQSHPRSLQTPIPQTPCTPQADSHHYHTSKRRPIRIFIALPGDAGSNAGAGDSAAGAAGHDAGSITLSRGAIIAIIVIASVVCIFGIAMSVLWYFAKKRSWEVRATLRKSARKVASALTPRRTTFPKDVQTPRRSTRGLTKIEEVPNTPRNQNNDIEKGGKMAAFEMSEPPKSSKWGRKLGR